MRKPLLAIALLCAGAGSCRPPEGRDGGSPAPIRLSFSVDASARPGLYADGELLWQGSFSFDASAQRLSFSPDWVRPGVPLYDDGPWTSGGHEPAGALAHDDVFGTSVQLVPAAEEIAFDYGLGTTAGAWLWVGPNGRFVVPALATQDVSVPGMTFPPGGDVDLKLTLDTLHLGEGATGVGLPIKAEGTFNGWLGDLAYDDGTHGDETPGDGVYTYTLSLNESPRLLSTSGTEEHFIWMLGRQPYFAMERPDGGGTAQTQGARGYTRGPGDAGFIEQPLFLSPAYEGSYNWITTVAIP